MKNPKFSPCQKEALKILENSRDNIFLTGHAGTGKSFLIRHFLTDKPRKEFPVLASTGVAAVLLGGRTFHSFFGLGIMEGGYEASIRRALDNKRVVSRLRDIDGFVLDEVSMISGPTLSAAEKICRLARKVKAPWGGARVVAMGDFAQLPPVQSRSSQRAWAFLDDVWEASEWNPIVLKTTMRSSDQEYLEILNSIRHGQITDEVKTYLNRKTDAENMSDEMFETSSTCLFPRRETAHQLNLTRLSRISEKLYEIPTVYSGEARAIETLKKQAPIPESLHLKKTAMVMIRVNDPGYRYVNGTLAKILDIDDDFLTLELSNKRVEMLEKHAFTLLNADGEEAAVAINFPVSLAYATTIHKSQGSTLDRMCCDLRRLWEPGQAYVALSRLRSGEGLSLIGWDESSILVDPHVIAFHEKLT